MSGVKKRKFIIGVLKPTVFPFHSDLEVVLKTKVYSRKAKDYLHSVGLGVEEAIKLFGADKVAKALEGETVRVKTKVENLFNKRELRDLIFK